MKKHIPNVLTIARLVLTAVMFAAMVLMNGYLDAVRVLTALAFGAFALAAITDFFDGYLARRWGVVSTMGAILDPIADKVLVCGAILGLLGLGLNQLLIPGALILFREFAVSAMREVLAPKGLKLPVTLLAKTKTTLQLLALGMVLGLMAWMAWLGDTAEQVVYIVEIAALFLLWIAALVTVWTGVQYALAARRALASRP